MSRKTLEVTAAFIYAAMVAEDRKIKAAQEKRIEAMAEAFRFAMTFANDDVKTALEYMDRTVKAGLYAIAKAKNGGTVPQSIRSRFTKFYTACERKPQEVIAWADYGYASRTVSLTDITDSRRTVSPKAKRFSAKREAAKYTVTQLQAMLAYARKAAK